MGKVAEKGWQSARNVWGQAHLLGDDDFQA